MAKKKINRNNLPSSLPLNSTVLYSFLMYYFDAREWMWTAFIILFVLIWISSIVNIIKDDYVDILNGDENNLPKFDNPPTPPKKSKFQERLDSYMGDKNE